MKKVFYFPPANGKGGYGNPYSVNYKSALTEYFDVLESDNAPQKYSILGGYILKRAFQADVYIFNWIEDIGRYRLPLLQWILTVIAIFCIKLRRRKIIWMFHNIQPHYGETFYSKTIFSILFRVSNLIISHSKKATEYAKSKSNRTVKFICHPIKRFSSEELSFNGIIEPCDIFLWGSIIRYKGIAEFISLPEIQNSNLKIRILGCSKDKELIQEIKRFTTTNIILDERRASFGEIAKYCQESKYVIFPYIGESISSSGALIDTLVLGGVPIGPHVGAFSDLAEENVCLTYRNIDELIRLLASGKPHLNTDKFIDSNSWEHFAEFIHKSIS